MSQNIRDLKQTTSSSNETVYVNFTNVKLFGANFKITCETTSKSMDLPTAQLLMSKLEQLKPEDLMKVIMDRIQLTGINKSNAGLTITDQI